MSEESNAGRLSRIDTLWTVLRQAHAGAGHASTEAQQALIQRYSGAIYHYLLAVLHDPVAADDVFQEFALSFLQGGFKKADPSKGRFRDYVKSALFHLIAKYRRGMRREPGQADSLALRTATDQGPTADEDFRRAWRDEVLARTWESLATLEKRTGKPWHTVLAWRTQHPEQDSVEMAMELGRQLGKKLTAEGVRQTVHRARQKFAELLLNEIGHSLPDHSPDALEAELIDLGLLPYCEDALNRRRQSATDSGQVPAATG